MLGRNAICTEGVKALAQALLQNSSVTELDICTYAKFCNDDSIALNKAETAGAIAVAEMLMKNYTLTMLDLGLFSAFLPAE